MEVDRWSTNIGVFKLKKLILRDSSVVNHLSSGGCLYVQYAALSINLQPQNTSRNPNPQPINLRNIQSNPIIKAALKSPSHSEKNDGKFTEIGPITDYRLIFNRFNYLINFFEFQKIWYRFSSLGILICFTLIFCV